MTAIFPGDIKSFTAVIDNFDVVEAANINPVYEEITSIETWLERALPIGYHSRTAALTTDLTLSDTDYPIQYLDPTTDEFTVSLPSSTDTNHIYFIRNTNAAVALSVLSGTDEVVSVGAETTTMLVSDGTTWSAISGGGGGSTDTITYSTTIMDISDTDSAGTTDAVSRGDHKHKLNIGDGLEWDGDTLKATGGGGGGHIIEDEGTPLTARDTLNVLGGGAVAEDDAVNEKTKLTVLTKYPCCGRLTLESGVPVSTTAQADKTTLYFTPYQGDTIALFDGTRWKEHTFSELSLNISAYTASKPYDIWAYDNSGTVALDSTVWTDGTTRATALTTQNGVYVKNGATTRRYLGTIYIDSGQKCQDTLTKLYVWNYYNQVLKRLYNTENSGHTYSPGTAKTYYFRAWNNDAANSFSFVIGVQEKPSLAWIGADSRIVSSGSYPGVLFGLDDYSGDANDDPSYYSLGFAVNNSTTQIYGGAGGLMYSGIGKHDLYIIERGYGTNPNGAGFTAYYSSFGVYA